jgi:hypothetical protein
MKRPADDRPTQSGVPGGITLARGGCMTDLLAIGAIAAFFVVAWAYTKACDRL